MCSCAFQAHIRSYLLLSALLKLTKVRGRMFILASSGLAVFECIPSRESCRKSCLVRPSEAVKNYIAKTACLVFGIWSSALRNFAFPDFTDTFLRLGWPPICFLARGSTETCEQGRAAVATSVRRLSYHRLIRRSYNGATSRVVSTVR